MKTMKRALAVLLAAVLLCVGALLTAFPFAPVMASAETYCSVEDHIQIVGNNSAGGEALNNCLSVSVTLAVGAEINLNDLFPLDSADSFHVHTSNPNVVQINDGGILTAETPGEAEVTITSIEGFVLSLCVSVIMVYHNGDIFTLGSYPQTKVTNSSTISQLNNLLHSSDWISYNYSSSTNVNDMHDIDDGKMAKSDYMKYQDVTYNGAKYRAVMFSTFRPYNIGFKSLTKPRYQNATNGFIHYTWQDYHDLTINTVYWYRFEPLEWIVVDSSTGLLLSKNIIDCQPFNDYIIKDGDSWFGNSEKSFYASNYKESSIRYWLTNVFYETSFSTEEKEIILPSVLDNSCPDDPIYGSENTLDNVFLLSYDEAFNNLEKIDYPVITQYCISQGSTCGNPSCGENRPVSTDGFVATAFLLRTASISRCLYQVYYSVNNETHELKRLVTVGINSHTDGLGNIRPAIHVSLVSAAAIDHTEDDNHSYNEWMTLKAPLCTTEGRKCRICSICGYVQSETIGILNHTPGDTTIENEVPATCTAKGSYDEVIYCTACGEEISRETITVDPLGHAEATYTTPSTCAENGFTVTYCTRCGETLSHEIFPRLEHTWNDGEVTAEPTCTALGVKTFTCGGCGATYTEPVDKLAHDWDDGVVTKEPSCTEAGEMTYTCATGGETRTEPIDKLDHALVLIPGKAATCEEPGLTDGWQCETCQKWFAEQQPIEPTGHDMQIQSYVAPTCEEGGYAPFVCSRCGYTEKTDPEPALGHDYQPTYEWSADNSTVTASLVCIRCDDVQAKETVGTVCKTVEATCMNPGLLTYTSEGFANKAFYVQTKTIEIAQKPHMTTQIREVSPTCDREGVGSYWTCSTCDGIFEDEAATRPLTEPPVLPKLPHTPGEPVTENETAATCTAEGSYDTVVYCFACGQELSRETTETPVLDHTDADNDGHCDACGAQMQGGDHCKVCGKIHNGGFFDRLTGFFHRIIGIFKR